MARAKKEPKGNFIVTMQCVVTKEVIVENCTLSEAKNNPWDYSVDETELEQIDWKVVKVTENN
jgi:hypothetical protein